MGFRILVIMSLAAVAGAGVAQARKSGDTFREGDPRERVAVGRVAAIDQSLRVRSPWQSFGGPTSPHRTVWSVAYDSMAFNPLTNEAFSGIYGVTGGFFRFTNEYKNPYFANDIQLAAGTELRNAQRIILDLVWNPGGGPVRSGTARLATAIFAATTFGTNSSGASWTAPLGQPIPGSAPYFGVVIDWGVQPHGWRTYDANLSGVNPGLALPNGHGALVVVVGTLNAQDQFELCPPGFAMQPTLDNMAAIGDPNFPGFNPSRSGPLAWDDDGGAIFGSSFNGVHDNLASTSGEFTELYTYDWTDANLGFIQPASALFVNQGQPRFRANINVQNAPPPPLATLYFFSVDPEGNPILEPSGQPVYYPMTLPVSGNGSIEFPRVSLPGHLTPEADTARALIIADGVLPIYTPSFDLNDPRDLGRFPTWSGDADGSRQIGPEDFTIVLDNFGAQSGDAGFRASADLNRNGQVGPEDFSIVLTGFGSDSAPMPPIP